MTANELKLSIHQVVESVNDVTLLEAFKMAVNIILQEYKKEPDSGIGKKGGLQKGNEDEKIVIHTIDGQPLTKEQFAERVLAAVQRVRSGQYVSQEELNKEVENW